MKNLLFALTLALVSLSGSTSHAVANHQIPLGKYNIRQIAVYNDKTFVLVYLDRDLDTGDHDNCSIKNQVLISTKDIDHKNMISVLTAAYLTKKNVGFGIKGGCFTAGANTFPLVYRVNVGD